jgi:hypothetical protein
MTALKSAFLAAFGFVIASPSLPIAHGGTRQVPEDPDLVKRIQVLEERVGFSVKGGKPAPPAVLKQVEEVLKASQIADFECYENPGILDSTFLSRFWSQPSPEVTELQGKVARLLLRGRHYATDCIGKPDFIKGQEVIAEMISGYPNEAKAAGIHSVNDGFNLLAKMKGLPTKSDWSSQSDYKKLLCSSNLSFALIPGSVKLLRSPYVYAEADESWYWVLHDQKHQPIGGNYVYYIVPYVLKLESKGAKLYGSGTLTAKDPRTGVSLTRSGKRRGIG